MELLQPAHPTGPPGDRFSGFSPPGSFLHGFDQASPAVTSSASEIIEDGGERVHVAVGKSVEKSKSLLHWTLRRFGSCEICLVHVHQPSPLIPTLCKALSVKEFFWALTNALWILLSLWMFLVSFTTCFLVGFEICFHGFWLL